MKKRWTGWGGWAVVAFVATTVGGCEDTPDSEEPRLEAEIPEAVVEPPKTKEEKADEEFEPIVVEFPGWPGDREQMTFELMWLGGDEELELREFPEPASEVVAKGRWFDGEEFDWLKSLVVVEKPRAFRVEEDYETMATPYDVEFAELEAEDQLISLEEGERIYLYQDRGEGSCFMGTREGVVLGSCPEQKLSVEEKPQEHDDAWTAVDEKWWVKVEGDGGEGWFVVTEASVEVHPRQLDGYDEWEGAGEYGEYE